MRSLTRISLHVCVISLTFAGSASAQVYEAVGSRALGMAGAFVAVADDGTASWWNPAGPAAGPFLDLGAGKASGTSWVAAMIPPFGMAYYQFEVADNPTADPPGDRQGRGAGVPMRASQFGVTFVQTLLDGVHVGMTAKYIRNGGRAAMPAGTADVDAGVLAVVGAMRIGAVVRNVRAPEVGGARLDRQVRVGAAFDGEASGYGPAIVSLDVDLRTYDAPDGRRRVVAIGAERWFSDRRFGLRAGVRANTAGTRGKAGSAGMSAALRPGLYVDAHAIAGSAGERGWGAAGRISF